jgi:hypothetical protein
MRYEIQEIKTIVHDLPEYVICKAYGCTEIFRLYPHREITIYGPREGHRDDPFIYKLESNEVLYQSRFGWDLYVDIHTMTVISPRGSEWRAEWCAEWCGKKVYPINDSKILDPDNPFLNRYLEWHEPDEQKLDIEYDTKLIRDGFEMNYSFDVGDLVVVRKSWLEPYIKSLNGGESMFDYKPLERNKDKIGTVIKCNATFHCIEGASYEVDVQYDDEIVNNTTHAFIKYEKE